MKLRLGTADFRALFTTAAGYRVRGFAILEAPEFAARRGRAPAGTRFQTAGRLLGRSGTRSEARGQGGGGLHGILTSGITHEIKCLSAKFWRFEAFEAKKKKKHTHTETI